MNLRTPWWILTLCLGVAAENQDGVRPRILGLAHATFYVSDLQKARSFYEDFLGFQEPFVLKRDDGSIRVVFVKVNDKQYIELLTDRSAHDGRLNDVAIYTDNARQMRDYLALRGLKVPEKVARGASGNDSFTVTDPDGHGLEIVEYEQESWTGQNHGKFLPSSRISKHVMHLGFLVRDLDSAMKFYRDVLGFKEFWRGSSNGRELSWVNMRVPEGDDYFEFMLFTGTPSAQERGVKNHISLTVPEIQKAVAELQARAAKTSYSREMKVQIGKNHKRQVNLFDPDGTRVELMEPKTVDGFPAPSSQAPAPR